MEEAGPMEELEQALRDERAERVTAQRRAAKMAERSEIWETRAVERSARIERLLAEQEQLRTVGGWLRARRGRRGSAPRVRTTPPARIATPTHVPPSATARGSVESAHQPAYPAVQVVAIVDDPLVRSECTSRAGLRPLPRWEDSLTTVVVGQRNRFGMA
jgi:hypothetical protein